MCAFLFTPQLTLSRILKKTQQILMNIPPPLSRSLASIITVYAIKMQLSPVTHSLREPLSPTVYIMKQLRSASSSTLLVTNI